MGRVWYSGILTGPPGSKTHGTPSESPGVSVPMFRNIILTTSPFLPLLRNSGDSSSVCILLPAAHMHICGMAFKRSVP